MIFRNYLSRAAFATIFRRTDHFIVTVEEKFVIKIPAGDQAAASILFDRQYSPREAHMLMGLLGLCNSFVDVGANLGYFALMALARNGGAKRVVAVEPNPVLATLIQESMELNAFHSGSVLCAALGAHSGEGELVLDAHRSSTARVRSCSYAPSNNGAIRVRVVTLDEVYSMWPLGRALIKIDVEGCETDVFRGASAALLAGAILVSEVSSRSIPEICAMLDQYGYCPLRENGIPYTPGVRTRMLVFAPRSLMEAVTEVLVSSNKA